MNMSGKSSSEQRNWQTFLQPPLPMSSPIWKNPARAAEQSSLIHDWSVCVHQLFALRVRAEELTVLLRGCLFSSDKRSPSTSSPLPERSGAFDLSLCSAARWSPRSLCSVSGVITRRKDIVKPFSSKVLARHALEIFPSTKYEPLS